MWAELPVWKQPTSLGNESLEIFHHGRFKVLPFCHFSVFFTAGKKRRKKTAVYFKWTFFVLKAKSITKQFDISWSFFWKCYCSCLQNCHLQVFRDDGHFSSVTTTVKSNLYVFVGPTFGEKWVLKQICPLWCHKEQYTLSQQGQWRH